MVIVFFTIWFIFFSITPGVFVPSGLFLPGLIIGSAVGLLYMQFLVYAMGISIDKIGGQSYVIIGASAMLASYTRMTYSLAVIMLETTQSINNFLPITLGIAVSLVVSRIFNRGLYDYSMRAK
jgi:chloride channel 7